MNLARPLNVPKEFENFRDHLQNSAAKTALIHPVPRQPKIHESKLAGFPYLPHNETHPKDYYGNYMVFLAQTNFSEIHLGTPFPTHGLLQFFISQHCYRLAQWGSTKGLFQVRYYPKLTNEEKLISDFSYLESVDTTDFPITEEHGIEFSTVIEPVSATDYRLTHYFNPLLLQERVPMDGRTFSDLYLEKFLSAEHKIGGYPYFIGEDFRKSSSHFQHYDTLLLQIVSNDAQGIMWGDSGIISFFINSKKLQLLDFSDIYFYMEDY